MSLKQIFDGLLLRTLLRVLPVATIAMLLVGVVASMVVENSFHRHVQANLEKDARFGAETVASKLDAVLSSIRSVAANDLILNGLVDTEAREAYVPLYFNQLQIAGVRAGGRISFTDYRGRRIASNWSGGDYRDAKWLYRVINNAREYIHFGNEGATLVIPVIYEGSAEGAIAVEFEKLQLAQIVSIPLASRAVVISSPKGELFSSDADFSGVLNRDKDAAAEWIQVTTPVKGYPEISVTIAERADVAFAAVYKIEKSLFLALVLALMALASGIVSTAYLTTRPLAGFAAELKRFGVARDLTRRVRSEGASEFRDLADSFNSMLERLQKTVVSNEQLEREIEMRKRAEDIRRKARKEIRDKEARTRAIVDSALEGIITIDAQGRIESFNNAATTIFGYLPEEVIGKNIKILMPEPVRSAHNGFLQNYIETGTPSASSVIGTVREVDGCRKDGSTFPMDLAVSPMSIDGKQMFAGMIRDITDRRKAEVALQQQNERFNIALENMSQGLCVFDSDQRIVVCNERYATMYGLTPWMVQPGATLREIVELRVANGVYAGESPENYVEERLSWGQDGDHDDVTVQEMCDGRSIRVLRQQLSGGGWVATHEDITEAKRMERLKSEFVSVVSHELRTPLTSLIGSIRLANSGKLGTVPDKARSLLEVAYRNAERLKLLVNDILDVEKIDADSMDFVLVPVDMAELAQRVIDENNAYAAEFGVRLRLEASLGTVYANIDEHRMMQVLANLLSNAAKFSSPESEVVLSLTRENGALRVSVIDWGSGFPADKQSQLFERFFQVDASDSRSKQGTGLGLAIVKAIVEKHGSTIQVQSEVGKGSVFYFDLHEVDTPATAKSIPAEIERTAVA